MPHKDPARNREYQREWRKRNPDYYKGYIARRVSDNPRYHKEAKLRSQYGISLEQWDEMFERQAGLCSICRSESPLHVDHDHDTGQVRELLCTKCNLGIGCFEDDPDTLTRAAEYAAKWRKK